MQKNLLISPGRSQLSRGISEWQLLFYRYIITQSKTEYKQWPANTALSKTANFYWTILYIYTIFILSSY